MKTPRPQKPLDPKLALLGLMLVVSAVIICCGVIFGDDDEKDNASATSTSAPTSTSAEPQQFVSLSPSPSPSPTRTASPKPKPSPSVYYADCDAVADAGLYRITKGSPGYRKALDRNGDGIACNYGDDPDYVDDSSDDGGDVYYANCSEARAAGAAPIHRGEPGYRKGLDRDGDGTACDS